MESSEELKPKDGTEINSAAQEGGGGSKPAPLLCSSRLGLSLIAFVGYVNMYSLRVNMSVAMVCMANDTAPDSNVIYDNTTMTMSPVTGPTQESEICFNDATNSNSTQPEGEFNWDKETQGLILGSFFWGYLVTQIPGGWLAGRFGGKRIFGYFMLVSAIATLLCPVGARGSPYALVFLRVVNGIGQGVVWPSMHSLWATWAPPLERSKLVGINYAGAQIGNVITFPVSGVLCERGFAGGWPAIFYVFGAFGVLWFILWMFLAFDSPAKHPRCSPRERLYIEESIGATKEQLQARKGTPWKKIFSSLPVWAIIIAHTCANWGTYALLTNIPTYMREVLKFDISSNGVFSAIPYIAFWAVITIGGLVADKIRSSGCMSTVAVRKMMNSLGMFLPGIFLVVTGFISCKQPYVAVAVLTLAVGFSGLQYSGFIVNHVDIAPPFAGILFGISNTAATLPGILAPYAIAVITVDKTQAQWQNVFYISAAIYTFGAIFYIIFAEGELQDWARPYMFDEKSPDSYDTIVGDNFGSRDVLPVMNGNASDVKEDSAKQFESLDFTKL